MKNVEWYVKNADRQITVSEQAVFDALVRCVERGYSRDEEPTLVANYYMWQLASEEGLEAQKKFESEENENELT